MTHDRVELTVAELAKLTEEVRAPGGAGDAPHTKRFNEAMIAALRAGQGHIEGELSGIDLLIMTSTGRRSGKQHAVPLAYFVIDGRLLVVASMGGADINPPWYFNVIANPNVRVELNGVAFDAVATPTKGADRDQLYAGVCSRLPVFKDYQERTTRVIPVIELVAARTDLVRSLGSDALGRS